MRKTRSWIPAAAGLAGLAVVLATTAPAASQVTRLRLQDASPADAAPEVARSVGAPLEIRGGKGRKLTLDLLSQSPGRTLDQVAAALGGSWRMKLRVRPGRTRKSEPPRGLEQELALGLQDISAARAFGLVARDLKAELDLEGLADRRVALLAVNLPAHAVLERLAEQADASWSISYVIEATDAPVTPPPVDPGPAAPLRIEPAPPTVPPSAVAPGPRPRPTTPTGPELRLQLWGALNRLVRVPPDRREEGVWELVFWAEELFRTLDTLPAGERQERLRFAAPLLSQWRSLYNGLAPNVRKQLAPITELLQRYL